MQKLTIALMAAVVTLTSVPALARDDRLRFSIKDALATEAAKKVLNGEVRFYFGNQEHGPVEKNFGEFSSNKKTNAFTKSDRQACERAFLSALISFQQRAQREGGNAVINLRSNYRNVEFTSDTEFECGAGAIIAGVTLKGTVVKLR